MTTLLVMPKNVAEEQIEAVREALSPRPLRTTSEEYALRFFDAGGWDAWIRILAQGKDILTQKPLFDEIYCLHPERGKSSAGIVVRALHAGKPVRYIDTDGTHRTVVSVEQTDPDDWVTGWTINYI